MKNQYKGIFLILMSQIIWGLNAAILRTVDFEVPTSLMVMLRQIIGFGFLLTIILLNKDQRKHLFELDRKTWLGIFALGIISSGFADLLLTQGIRYSGAIVATLIARLEIPITVLLAAYIFHEKITKKVFIATFFSVLGLVFLAQNGISALSSTNQYLLGLGLAFAAALFWGIGTILAKYILSNQKTKPLVVTTLRLIVGASIAGIIFINSDASLYDTLSAISPADWLRIGYMGIFSSAVGYYFFYKGLEILQANQTALLLTISIAVNILAGFFIGETLSMYQWLGIGAIIMSILILNWPKKTSI